MSAPPSGPYLSPDGKHRWENGRWVPTVEPWRIRWWGWAAIIGCAVVLAMGLLASNSSVPARTAASTPLGRDGDNRGNTPTPAPGFTDGNCGGNCAVDKGTMLQLLTVEWGFTDRRYAPQTGTQFVRLTFRFENRGTETTPASLHDLKFRDSHGVERGYVIGPIDYWQDVDLAAHGDFGPKTAIFHASADSHSGVLIWQPRATFHYLQVR